MKVKLKGQKIIASVVVAAMSFTLIPKISGSNIVMAATTKDQSNTSLCVSAIGNPTSGGSTDSAWSGSYVYFGTYDNTPIKFRVLQKDLTAYTNTESPTLFLDSDAILKTIRFDDDLNVWADSELKTYLNDNSSTGFLYGFTDLEQGAIAESKIGTHPLEEGTSAGKVARWTAEIFENFVALNDDKVFVLDMEEASNSTYGYSVYNEYGESCASRKKSGGIGYWWLRSAEADDDYFTGYVYSNGNMIYNYVINDDIGVAPALNINQSSIIFSTCVDGTYGQVGASYKLTILDDSLSITAGEASVSGATVSIGNTISGGPTRISVLILDKEYTDRNTNDATIKYYGALSEEDSFDFSSTGLDLAGWGKDYYVYILAEKINGDFETDYATKPVEVAAPAGVATTTYSVDVSISTYDKDGNLTTEAVGGTVTVDKTSGITGDKVTITATPNEGYELVSIEYGNGALAGVDITTAKEFTIEDYDVCVDVAFKAVDAVSSGGSTTTDPATGTSSDTTTDPATSGSTTTDPATGTSSGTTTDPATSGSTTTDPASGTSSDASGSNSGATMDPSAPTYKVIQGAGATVDGTTDYVVEVERSIDDEHCLDYYDWTAIDGVKLTAEQAPASSGSTVVTIKSDYLKTLGEGQHTIVINFVDNSVSTTFTIQSAAQKGGANIPATGELQSPAMYIGMALIALACGVTGIVLVKKRKEV